MASTARTRTTRYALRTVAGWCVLLCLSAGTARAEDKLERMDRELQGLRKQVAALVEVPVGTIMSYGGDLGDPGVRERLRRQGWLPCDGAELAGGEQPDLYAAIGTAFGGDKDTGRFRLPDLRGRFVRGVSGDAKNGDPDAATRTQSAPGGYAGDRVGSLQEDAFQGHHHTTTAINGNTYRDSGGGVSYKPKTDAASVGDAKADGTHGTPRISSETRPKNVYVHWIIKARASPVAAP